MQISKYSASGNDFLIFHTLIERDYSKLAKKLCHRHKGVGADGLIVLVPSSECDFKWLFYNCDGSYAAMCGNGTRACAHYAFTNKLAKKKMTFLTGAGLVNSTVKGNIVKSELTEVSKLLNKFNEEDREWHFYNVGVPHLVTKVKNLNEYNKKLASKMRYKYDANVNFVLQTKESLHVRTYERGVENETSACGTGMAASFYSLHVEGLVGNCAKVYPASKEELNLSISKGRLFLKGKVVKVFETNI
ncbi:MAG: diaminopimelate epimerase [Sulfurospirillum sp.]|nr:diaminopimelate epimerase [Sulfurospirillum sp.]